MTESKQNKRPPSRSRGDTILEVLALAGLLVGPLLLLLYWPSIPEEIPSAFDALGRPTAWTHRFWLWGLPISALLAFGVMNLLIRVPQRFAFPWVTPENEGRQHHIIRSMIRATKAVWMWLLAFGSWRQCQVSIGEDAGSSILFIGVFLCFTIGVFTVYPLRAHRAR